MKAGSIVKRLDEAATRQGHSEFKRQEIRNYFNAGQMPKYGKCKKRMKSLGLGVNYARKPFNQINSEFIRKPGPVAAEVYEPLYPERSPDIIRALKEELNPIVKKALKSVVRSISGDWLLFGRSFAWRNSKDTAKWRAGQILLPENAPDDIYDDEFWWWGFRSTISLREIDKVIADQRDDSLIAKNGWSLKNIRALKKWILEEKEEEKPENERRIITDNCINSPFPDDIDPVSVYYYFHKSEQLEGCERKIHLKIVSRYGETRTNNRDGFHFDLSNPKREKEEIIYELDNAFDSIEQCLAAPIGDSRIGGEQRLDQVEGYLELMLPRILRKEVLTDSWTKGAAFASQPNWQAKAGNDAEKQRYLTKISSNGIGPWDTVSDFVQPMDKSNIIGNMRGAGEVIGFLDAHNERDAALGELPQGNRDRRVASEGQHLVNSLQQEISIRSTLWNESITPIIQQICELLCRPVSKGGVLNSISEWRSKDESYYCAKEFQERMKDKHGIHQSEYECSSRVKRIKFWYRDFAGGSDRDESETKAMKVLAVTDDPEIQRNAMRELMTAIYDDDYAEKVIPNNRPVNHDQQESAMIQINSALNTGAVMEPHAGDNAGLHTQLNLKAIQSVVTTASAQGYSTPYQVMGIKALVQHAIMDMKRLPKQAMMRAFGFLSQLTRGFSSIPVNQAGSKLDLDTRKQNHTELMGNNLAQTRNAATAMKAEQMEQNRLSNEARTAADLSEAQSRIERNQATTEGTELSNEEKRQSQPVQPLDQIQLAI